MPVRFPAPAGRKSGQDRERASCFAHCKMRENPRCWSECQPRKEPPRIPGLGSQRSRRPFHQARLPNPGEAAVAASGLGSPRSSLRTTSARRAASRHIRAGGSRRENVSCATITLTLTYLWVDPNIRRNGRCAAPSSAKPSATAASLKNSAAVAWAWCMRPRTSSLDATSR